VTVVNLKGWRPRPGFRLIVGVEGDAVKELERLLGLIQEVAAGHYSNDIMELTRPEVPEPVRTIAEAMGMMMVKVEAREVRLEMLVEDLRRANERIRQTTIATISTLANALAARDRYTEGHAARVGELSGKIAAELGLAPEEVERVRLAGRLHDIGKIGFSDLLFQPHLVQNPPEVVKEIVRHPACGADILKELDFLGAAVDYVHCHHERPDGKGYPRRLKEAEIPLGARIVAVADGYDAMTTDRPYRQRMSSQVALGILQEHAGRKWDAQCVAALGEVLGREG
jgi:putative nucleotidyltransferase with HDIG domain